VEVISPSSSRYDRVTKLKYYASIGVPEDWIIDPEAHTLERLLVREGAYVIADSLAEDAPFRPETFAGLEIPLLELWSPPGAGEGP
jgi:Uma2 family endonuclease